LPVFEEGSISIGPSIILGTTIGLITKNSANDLFQFTVVQFYNVFLSSYRCAFSKLTHLNKSNVLDFNPIYASVINKPRQTSDTNRNQGLSLVKENCMFDQHTALSGSSDSVSWTIPVLT